MSLKMPDGSIPDIGQREECEIPEYCKPNLEIYREKLIGSSCGDQ